MQTWRCSPSRVIAEEHLPVQEMIQAQLPTRMSLILTGRSNMGSVISLLKIHVQHRHLIPIFLMSYFITTAASFTTKGTVSSRANTIFNRNAQSVQSITGFSL